MTTVAEDAVADPRARTASSAPLRNPTTGAPGRVRVAYILAASHSGSTLLSLLLGAHPEICTTGELNLRDLFDATTYHCSCGVLLSQCDFWCRVREAMARRGQAFDPGDARTDFRDAGGRLARRFLRPLHRGRLAEFARDTVLRVAPGWQRDVCALQQRNAALAASICEVAGKPVIADSSKIALRAKYLLRNPALDVRIVRVIRDGRAVMLTYMYPFEYADSRDPHRRAGGTGEPYPGQYATPDEAAYRWRRSNEEAEALVRQLDPSRVIEVRYEQVCLEPQTTLRRIAAFLGVDPATVSLDYRAATPHVVGNGMRMDRTAEVKLDERWRTVLTPDHLRAFNRVAGALNRRYGYA